ncbi:hypothetical protein NEDG_00318 [Nematocida displodere]|uniref:Uncharacterized protein n=1 Tax=Nematocida displodere TaxID=1805483 RepID=A0A177EIQ3_9MICR|nr:hypothetical protein NEDG_00318 [Nematocida displodere]
MVHRPIFLGISTGVSYTKQVLNLSITINDGFFVLGIKNYAFPIITSAEDGSSSSSGLSPQMSLPSPGSEEDSEFAEIKGIYIDIKKKIVLNHYSTSKLCNNKMNHVLSPKTAAWLSCQISQEGKDCHIGKNVISIIPQVIEKEMAKDDDADPNEVISFEYFEYDMLNIIGDVLVVALDKWIGEYSKGNAIKIVGAGIATSALTISNFGDRLKELLWKKYDILPCFFSGGGKAIDQQSESLARKCAHLFGQENLPRLSIMENNRVNIDTGNIWFCSLKDYQTELGDKGTVLLEDLIAAHADTNTQKVAFFSSTPQGGGVALMRHALVRFFQMLGTDASWYVCVPSPSVFAITKKKFHNILQGVAPPDVELTDEDKSKVEKWLTMNYEANWRSVIQQCSVVVLDDHQVSGLVPMIKRDNKNVKIIYRSHIQIRSELMKDNTPIKRVWDYLWQSLKDVDYFVSHPIDTAVPEDVPKEKVIFQPAGTDTLDGLNKTLSESMNRYYQNVFNRVCIDNGETLVNFANPYIVQIARFDPSKGIPDLLDAYYRLYAMHMEKQEHEPFIVGLVLCGHGSVDDPESSTIFDRLGVLLNQEKYLPIKHLITKIRLPPSDQLLNVILRNAKVCCQLSVCEGYEVKVTESLLKGVPPIVYSVGGLPLQVKNGVNGYVVEKGNTTQVAEHLYALFYDSALYRQIKQSINPKDFLHITTPFQALFWLKLFKMADTSVPSGKTNLFEEMISKYLV